jgi:hypothetical protein
VDHGPVSIFCRCSWSWRMIMCLRSGLWTWLGGQKIRYSSNFEAGSDVFDECVSDT